MVTSQMKSVNAIERFSYNFSVTNKNERGGNFMDKAIKVVSLFQR